jgi:iron(III) transport system substrate-binding protein
MMSPSKIAVLVCFLALLAVPFLFRPAQPAPPAGALRLIIITPHNEQIRYEFGRAFDAWHEQKYGQRVNVIFSVPGGTSEIRRMLFAQFTAAVEGGREPGGDADLVFGGGSYEHNQLKRGVTVTVPGETMQVPITTPVDFPDDWLQQIYGENIIGDTKLYDEDKYWFGTALSGFGIVYNRDVLRSLDLDEPVYWEHLCHPKLYGWLALVNPSQSGSITTAFDTILQRHGWEQGWRILRRAAANSRYFSASALKPPTDVSQGDAAMGICIDFYGRYQAQAILAAGGDDRVGYVDPPGASTIDPDPISMLRNGPNPELAKRFIEFCLTEQAQALWQFPVRGEDAEDDLGPVRFELRRLPVLRSMYDAYQPRMIDQVNAFELAAPLDHPHPDIRAFVSVMFSAMAMDNHHDLQRAWRAILQHPAYPDHGGIVTADDVSDPTLKHMLKQFDALPTIAGPDGQRYSMQDIEHVSIVRQGWLREQWRDADLWNEQSTPADEMRRRFGQFFRKTYREIEQASGR